ncbi:CPBP family intramembrane metalloprotease [Enterobacter sp. Ap-916]|uniref:CPBP family intramembrane glutamic endopeptidase n=1 Tax=unclassified Enterobacter TaxID=2608935 RepID=UPI00141EC376|nr:MULTISPECIES: CPBP family intramembrane glutamic endopeptidase [unclassified Enterobacter]NIF59339.1 CPBP family intramembrane metalloprotease [Enterobacter sp. Ap-867]NIG30935.1 CPBP family intramembrane metalloprotease [Enterobacter sp. Ap-916]
MSGTDNIPVYSKGLNIFTHSHVTAFYLFITFSLSIVFTSIPVLIINHTDTGLDSALFIMCMAEFLLALISYLVYLHRLSEFRLSSFSARQFICLVTLIIALQISVVLLSTSGFHKKTTVLFDVIPFITLTFVIPVYEEIFYRGCLFGFICSLYKKGIILPSVLCSVVFSLMHTQYMSFIEYALMFSVGLILTHARVISRGLLLPIVLHSTMNAFVLIFNSFLSK